MVAIIAVGGSSATSHIQEFTDLDEGPKYEELLHERWLDNPDDLPGRYAAIFCIGQSKVNMLKSMKPGITQFNHERKLWTYVGVVRVATSGHGDELEPHFKFSTSPYNVKYFAARCVLDYLEFEAADREGMI